jgi:hypothetical protein
MVEREMLTVNKRRPEDSGEPCEQGLMRNRESAHERVRVWVASSIFRTFVLRFSINSVVRGGLWGSGQREWVI